MRHMEWFVALIVSGGLVLLTGLWATALADPQSVPSLIGVGLIVVGLASLILGIGSRIEP